MHTARVVADHPAEIAVLVRRGIRAESKIKLVGSLAQLIQHNTRLGPGKFFRWIDLKNQIQIFREIDNDRDGARLAVRAGSCAPWQKGRSVLARQSNRLDDIFYAARNDNADGRLPIVRAIDGVESACALIEADLAHESGTQVSGERLSVVARKPSEISFS